MKWIKWIVIFGVLIQAGSYWNVKYNIPKKVVNMLSEKGCEGYEHFGSNVPISYMYETETEMLLYLDSPTGKTVKLKVGLIDPSLPFLKGITNFKWTISGSEMAEHFRGCVETY